VKDGSWGEQLAGGAGAMAFVLAAPALPTRRPGQQTGSKRLKWASLNHAESHREEPENPHE
jgi:hypothetical protein